MWIFGYGSLVWKADFPYEVKIYGYVKDYARRFWQASPDHRGTPELPGRTVTLVESAGHRTWGAVYKVADDSVTAVRQQLDHREKAGYELRNIMFHPGESEGESFPVQVYINSGQSEYYLGQQTITDISERIVNAIGPSGSNIEYLLKLAASMRSITKASDAVDEHLANVEATVLLMCAERNLHDPVFDELSIKLPTIDFNNQ